MAMGIAPEDMDPNDFRGNEDTGRRRREFNEEDDSANLMLTQQLAMMQAMDDEGRVGGPCANPCNDDCDCGSCDDGGCVNGCCVGSSSMSQVRARALSESDLKRLIRRAIHEEKILNVQSVTSLYQPSIGRRRSKSMYIM